MINSDEKNKYFYDFGDAEPSDELPPAMEELNKQIADKKARILQERDNHRKAQQIRQCVTKSKSNNKIK